MEQKLCRPQRNLIADVLKMTGLLVLPYTRLCYHARTTDGLQLYHAESFMASWSTALLFTRACIMDIEYRLTHLWHSRAAHVQAINLPTDRLSG
jgi:hypothetical protein